MAIGLDHLATLRDILHIHPGLAGTAEAVQLRVGGRPLQGGRPSPAGPAQEEPGLRVQVQDRVQLRHAEAAQRHLRGVPRQRECSTQFNGY